MAALPQGITVMLPGEFVEEPIVAGTFEMRAAVERLVQLSDENRSAYIIGESGVGVGWLCRWVHRRSEQRQTPLVVIHLGPFPKCEHENLLSVGSEYIAAARGGTLVVRCFEDLSHPLRRRLIEQRDFRLVATSYGDYATYTTASSDFEAVVRVPPLRERPDDIPKLVDVIWPTLDYAASGVRPTRNQLTRLCAYTWPGNVRELRNRLQVWAVTGELPLP